MCLLLRLTDLGLQGTRRIDFHLSIFSDLEVVSDLPVNFNLLLRKSDMLELLRLTGCLLLRLFVEPVERHYSFF